MKKAESKKVSSELRKEAYKLFNQVKSKMQARTRDNYDSILQYNSNIHTLRRIINELKIRVENKDTKMTVTQVKKIKTERLLEDKKEYQVTGKIKFQIKNVDKKGREVLSAVRTKQFNFRTPKIGKSQITKLYLDEGSDKYVKVFVTDYDKLIDELGVSDIQITELSKTSLSSQPMGNKQIKYSNRILEKGDDINMNQGECVIDYLLYELGGKPGFKSINRKSLIKYFNGTEVTTSQIIEFVKQYNTVSMYAIDPLGKVFEKHIASDKKYSLCFVMNNNHLYPILDADTKKSIAMTNKITLQDYKFIPSYDNIQFIRKYKSIDQIDNEKSVILINDIDDVLLNIMDDVIKSTGLMITNIKFHAGKPIAFQHPKTLQIFEVTEDYYERKQIVNDLTLKYGQNVVRFTNQTYTEIAKIIFDNEFGKLEQIKSNLSDKVYNILDTNHIKPYVATVSKDQKKDDNSMGFDIIKSYSSVLLNNNVDYHIFHQFDEVREFTHTSELVPGEYYISKPINLCDGLMKLPRGWYPSNFVRYVAKIKLIKKSDITMYIPAKQFLKADTFKSFVKHIYSTYDEYDAKKLINFFIGSLGTKRINKDVGAITNNFEIACSILLEYEQTHNVSIDTMNNYHFIRVRSEEKEYNTGLSIHRHIICGGIMNLAKLYYSINYPDMRVIAFNTDSIMIKYNGNDNDIYENLNMPDISDNIIDKIGKIRTEEWKIKSFKLFEFEDRELEVYEPLKWQTFNEENEPDYINKVNNFSSCLVSGMPGCGKTELIKNIRKETDLILSFTNTAVNNVKERCNDSDGLFYTFDTFFSEHLTFEEKLKKVEKYERIIVDEYSMVPVKQMGFLNIVKRIYNTKLFFFGDANQCLQVEPNGVIYDYPNTETFLKMCDGNKFICSYKEQYSRYDLTLKNLLDEFLNNQVVSLPLTLVNKKEKATYINICKTLFTKWEIIKKCSVRFQHENQDQKNMDVKFIKTIRNKICHIPVKITVGQNFMCGINDKENNIFNGTICKLVDILDNKIIISSLSNPSQQISYEPDEFIKDFEPAFAQTIYRYQGATIKEDYTIHELSIMSKRELYTSLSRGVSLDKVHFNYIYKKFVNLDVSKPVELILKIDNDIDEKYKEGKIYKITFNNCIYIGQTIQTLNERFEQHKAAKKGAEFIEQLNKNKHLAKIELIESYPCASLKELLLREYYYIQEYCQKKDITLLNTIHNNQKNKKVKETIIKQEKLEQINKEVDKYHIVENSLKNCLRYQAIIEGKKIDVSVSLKKKSKDQAMKEIMAKIQNIEYKILSENNIIPMLDKV